MHDRSPCEERSNSPLEKLTIQVSTLDLLEASSPNAYLLRSHRHRYRSASDHTSSSIVPPRGRYLVFGCTRPAPQKREFTHDTRSPSLRVGTHAHRIQAHPKIATFFDTVETLQRMDGDFAHWTLCRLMWRPIQTAVVPRGELEERMRAVLHAESITRLLKMRAVAQDRRARSSQDSEATIVSELGVYCWACTCDSSSSRGDVLSRNADPWVVVGTMPML